MRIPTRTALAMCCALLGFATIGAVPAADTIVGAPATAAAAEPVYDPTGPDGTIYRLYRAYFLREPDSGGFNYWYGVYRQGYPLRAISNDFARSDEFQSRYGNVDNRQFLDRVYRNVLGRTPDQAGYDYWVGQMNRGMLRGYVMIYFSDSVEFRNKTRDGVPPGYRTETVDMSGSGSRSFEMAIGGPVIVRSTHDGDSNFQITALDADGQYAGSAANEIGRYKGEQLLNPYRTDIRFIEVNADGNWTIQFAALNTAIAMDIVNGRGQGDVVRYVQVPAARQVRFTHDGDSNFIVTAIDGEGGYLRGLVNEIGTTNTSVVVPAETAFLEIVADGNWTTAAG